MLTTLCIDQGNTRTKAAVFSTADGKMIQHQEAALDAAPDMVRSLAATYKPGGIAIASVAGNTDNLHAAAEGHGPVLVVDSHTRTPIVNAYHSQGTLGADRLAVAVAAEHENPGKNCLVVSAGTCITYNFVAANRTFRGGAISPGMRMRLQAMHAFTDRLPEVSATGELLLLGYDTETCMRAGALLGAASEIHGMVQSYAAQYPDLKVVLTGGDAPFLARQLKNAIFADSFLALRGLHQILRHNVPSLR